MKQNLYHVKAHELVAFALIRFFHVRYDPSIEWQLYSLTTKMQCMVKLYFLRFSL